MNIIKRPISGLLPGDSDEKYNRSSTVLFLAVLKLPNSCGVEKDLQRHEKCWLNLKGPNFYHARCILICCQWWNHIFTGNAMHTRSIY